MYEKIKVKVSLSLIKYALRERNSKDTMFHLHFHQECYYFVENAINNQDFRSIVWSFTFGSKMSNLTSL